MTTFDQIGYNADNVDAQGDGSFQPLPLGEYRVVVAECFFKDDRNGNPCLSLTLNIAEPTKYDKRKLFDWLNLKHHDTVPREIAEKRFKAMHTSCGLPNVNGKGPDDLIGRVCWVRVTQYKTEVYNGAEKVREEFAYIMKEQTAKQTTKPTSASEAASYDDEPPF